MERISHLHYNSKYMLYVKQLLEQWLSTACENAILLTGM